MEGMDEVVQEFLIESHEGLDSMEQDLVSLEKSPDPEVLAAIFRTIHSIKGTSGVLGYQRLEAIAHAGENLLSRLRDGELRLDEPRTSVLLSMLDALRTLLRSIEQSEAEGEGDDGELVRRIEALTRDSDAPEPTGSSAHEGAESPSAGPSEPHSAPAAPASQAPTPSEPAQAVDSAAPTPAPAPQTQATPSAALAEAAPSEDSGARPHGVSDATIRVGVEILDKLMNLVGELVLTRNQILQYSSTREDMAFAATAQRLNLVTTELQEGVMKTRMQPIRNVWNKFPRVVRDLAVACEKRVVLDFEGGDTELDKTIIEAIRDPLTHAVRNAVDHGVESPEERVLAGKPVESRILLRAYHEGGQVNIEIADDGKGIDLGRVQERALERGLVTREAAERMSQRDLVDLIFHPGFSTAASVTTVSGRGVGMDVVKTNIERIGGTIDVHTVPGQGTTLRIKIPLTLAIIPALTITCGGERFAIPQASLLELVRLEGEQARAGVELVHGAPVYRLRGKLLPLVSLREQLEFDTDEAQGEATNPSLNIVVLQGERRQFGLVVDEINDTEEIVVKPLGKQLQGIALYSGATIMGDGQVALILDVMGIAETAGLVSREATAHEALGDAQRKGEGEGERTFLVVGLPGQRRVAVSLEDVSRLEEFPVEALERAGDLDVVQYRGGILPLLRAEEQLGMTHGTSEPALSIPVVVHRVGDRQVGLAVERIVDIVQEAVSVEHVADRAGILGTAVLQNRVTDLLDLHGLVERNPSLRS